MTDKINSALSDDQLSKVNGGIDMLDLDKLEYPDVECPNCHRKYDGIKVRLETTGLNLDAKGTGKYYCEYCKLDFDYPPIKS
ncbi:MAG: hypothetical protein IKX95_08740 [Lachnospiraceae bacterium]|nr:hypothetical protein [Lachnospiraceae bacterium]MBR5766855.1 hypothetical protein [Lachnospiraceae bacterium]